MNAEHPDRPVWFYRRVGRRYGPVTLRHLNRLAEEGRLHKKLDFIRHGERQSWLPAEEVEGIYRESLESGKIAPEILAKEAWEKQAPRRMEEVGVIKLATWTRLIRTSLLFLLGSLVLELESLRIAETVVDMSAVFVKLAIAFFVLAHLVLSRWVYLAWRLIGGGSVGVPAWLAALLLWVPGLNLVWFCVAFWVWAREFNVLMLSHPQFKYVKRPRDVWMMAFCVYPLAALLVHVVLLYILDRAIDGGVIPAALSSIRIDLALWLNGWIYFHIARVAVKDLARGLDDINDLNMRRI